MELARRMQKPRRVDMELLKSVGRYLAGRRRVGTIVGAVQRSGSLEVFTDSDWQGCPDTRKSTPGWSLTWNGQVLATGSPTQEGVPALSSAEAELGVAIAGEIEMSYAAHSLKQLGETVKEDILWTDSSVCKYILTRLGLGRSMHLEAPPQLYLQEKTRSAEVRLKMILGTLKPADVMAQSMDYAALERYFEKLGLLISECIPDTEVGI